jgi:hypothetical protein
VHIVYESEDRERLLCGSGILVGEESHPIFVQGDDDHDWEDEEEQRASKALQEIEQERVEGAEAAIVG